MLTYFILIFASVAVLLWVLLSLLSGQRYDELVEGVDSDLFPLKSLFPIGFFVLEKIHFSTKTARGIRRTDEISELSGKKYAEYYYYVSKAAEVTYGLLMLVVFSVLAALADSIVLLGVGILLVFLAVYYVEEQINNKLSDRKDELLSDFPQVLSKLTLLINSGMVVRDAWNLVAKSGTGTIYREMQETTVEFQNGVTEIDAYSNFAARCGIKEIRKFASTMVQNLQKGNAELVFFLKDMTDEMWEEKKNLCKRKGEAANSKLIIPTGLIFLGILALIMVPMLQQL
jgi:tight adherence protein C